MSTAPILTLVVDRAGAGWLDAVLRAVPRGSTGVQLRDKAPSGRDLLSLAQSVRGVTARHGALFLVNDRLDVARAVGADGVHLGRESVSPVDARHVWPAAHIGVSCHSLEEAVEAVQGGADLVVLGPIYETPSKRALGLEPRGPGLIASARARAGAAVPIMAIGGVTDVTAPQLRAAGASGLAVIRAVFAALDPPSAARRLVDSWLNLDPA